MAKKKRSVVVGLLKKLGKECSDKISESRAMKKLERALEKGIPDDVELDDNELKLLQDDMGYEIDFEEEEVEEEPSDDNLEEIEKEEKPKAKSKKKSSKKKEKKSSKKKEAPKKKRGDSICDVLKKLNKTGKTRNEIAKLADADFVKNGGNSNIKQTEHQLNVMAPVLENFEIIKVDGDKISPC